MTFAIFFLYYWSLLGSWFFIIDKITNNSLQKLGLHYYHIFDLLFKVELDSFYLQTIFFYGFFIIAFQTFILKIIRQKLFLEENIISLEYREEERDNWKIWYDDHFVFGRLGICFIL